MKLYRADTSAPTAPPTALHTQLRLMRAKHHLVEAMRDLDDLPPTDQRADTSGRIVAALISIEAHIQEVSTWISSTSAV